MNKFSIVRQLFSPSIARFRLSFCLGTKLASAVRIITVMSKNTIRLEEKTYVDTSIPNFDAIFSD